MMTEQERAEYRKEWRRRNPEKVSAWNRRWAAKNKDRLRASKKGWFEANKDRLKERAAASRKEWRLRNAESERLSKRRWQERNRDSVKQWRLNNKDKVSAYQRKYVARNQHKYAAISARHNAQKLRATPSWTNQFFIEEIYDLARRRTDCLGIAHHVDHVVPLQSKIVCGLHCEANLRVIPAQQNIRKGNRLWPDMPEPVLDDKR